mmetsp:Transcript_102351/g.265108  ORF Transcript_102351/g.265108 Transcript_102351/m.265108 type:complete len:307 (+) Transcript_102351:350-1270(+)
MPPGWGLGVTAVCCIGDLGDANLLRLCGTIPTIRIHKVIEAIAFRKDHEITLPGRDHTDHGSLLLVDELVHILVRQLHADVHIVVAIGLVCKTEELVGGKLHVISQNDLEHLLVLLLIQVVSKLRVAVECHRHTTVEDNLNQVRGVRESMSAIRWPAHPIGEPIPVPLELGMGIHIPPLRVCQLMPHVRVAQPPARIARAPDTDADDLQILAEPKVADQKQGPHLIALVRRGPGRSRGVSARAIRHLDLNLGQLQSSQVLILAVWRESTWHAILVICALRAFQSRRLAECGVERARQGTIPTLPII